MPKKTNTSRPPHALTLNPKPHSVNPGAPSIPRPTPYTLYRTPLIRGTPCTLHCKLKSLNSPWLCLLHPTPCALPPQRPPPCILHPTPQSPPPYTLHPMPRTSALCTLHPAPAPLHPTPYSIYILYTLTSYTLTPYCLPALSTPYRPTP